MRMKLPGQESRRRMAMRRFCPHCGALPSRPCVGTRGNIRSALHRDRYAVAEGEIPA